MKKSKNPLNSSVIFLQFSQLSEILGNSGKIVRICPRKQSCCRKQASLSFGLRPNLSAFVRFWKIKKNVPIFSRIFRRFISWISTEADVLWCFGGPQEMPLLIFYRFKTLVWVSRCRFCRCKCRFCSLMFQLSEKMKIKIPRNFLPAVLSETKLKSAKISFPPKN